MDETHLKSERHLDPVQIQCKWRDHQKGYGNFEHLLWTVLMFQNRHEHWHLK